jgi:hypothetical protein
MIIMLHIITKMLIYSSLCIIYTILNFFTSIIWKLQLKSIYKSPIFLVIFTSLVSYYSLKAGFLNNLNNIIPTQIMSFLSNGKYENYADKYFEKYIQLDSIISSVFFIVFGVLYLDLPNDKQKINQLKETINELKIDLGRCTLENRRLTRKNEKLLNLNDLNDLNVLDDLDDENQDFEPELDIEHIYPESENPGSRNPDDDHKSSSESESESSSESESESDKPTKMNLSELKEHVKKLIKSLKQFDSMINENDLAVNDSAVNDLAVNDLAVNDLAVNDLAIKEEINKQTRIKCRHYKNKILNIFIDYIRAYPKRNKITNTLKNVRKDINHIDF